MTAHLSPARAAPRLRGRLRKATLTVHVVTSVGWLGAVIASLALAVDALQNATDPLIVVGIDRTLQAIGWSTLVPLSFASLLTGVIQALGTRWGLLRHYWVLAKLVMNVIANVVLLLYMQTLDALADRPADAAPSTAVVASPVVHSAAALMLLLTATVLSIFKPPGTTNRRGRRPTQASD